MFLPLFDCLQCALIRLLIEFVQLKRDATPQVYQRFALLCRQYLEKSELPFRNFVYVNAVECGQLRPKQIVRDVFDGVFAGTGDDASRQVVSNQLLSLLTLRCVHFRASLNCKRGIVSEYLTSFPSQWPRTLGAVFQISHHQSPRFQPHSSHFRIEMFCLPNSVPHPQSAAFPRFLTEFCSKGQTAGLGRACWFAAAGCKAAGKIEQLAHRHFYLIRCEIFADSTAMYQD